MHLGGCYWLNVALFNKDLIDRYIASVVPKTRADSFFHLGLSVARLFELYPAGLPIVRAFAQLMEEWVSVPCVVVFVGTAHPLIVAA